MGTNSLEMALLDQSSLDPAENWGMVEMKESVLTYSLLALGMETKKKKKMNALETNSLFSVLFSFFPFFFLLWPHCYPVDHLHVSDIMSHPLKNYIA